MDIGAGTGRDAAWLASLSHRLVAVEPVDGLRNAGIATHKTSSITWMSDRLPELQQIVEFGREIDVILLSSVWQHLDDHERQIALSTFRKLISKNGKIIMSIRHGEGAPARPVYPASISDILKWAEPLGFKKLSEVTTQSAQVQNRRAIVTWTWLVLQA